jgi:HEAT repeat protein
MEVADFQAYKGMLASPYIPERYWLVRALGFSRKSETYKDLLAFLNDPHPNVVSMAFYALGRRRDRRAVKEIITRVTISDDWYNQWYAYKALRTLGWKQKRSR